MFHTTLRAASRSVVPISSTRPFAYSSATSFKKSMVIYRSMIATSGRSSANPSPKTPESQLCQRRTSLGPIIPPAWRSTSSYFGPRKAKGAIRAPALIPVTILNSGRVPLADHPTRRPAPKAPASPPPEIASAYSGGSLSDGLPALKSSAFSRSMAATPSRSIGAMSSSGQYRTPGAPTTPAAWVWLGGTPSRRGSVEHPVPTRAISIAIPSREGTGGEAIICTHALMNAKRSALISSGLVVHMPCGSPL